MDASPQAARLGRAALAAALVAAATLVLLPATARTVEESEATWSYTVRSANGTLELLPGTYFQRFELRAGQTLRADLASCRGGVPIRLPDPAWGIVAPGMNASEIVANQRPFQFGPCSNGTLFPRQAQPTVQLLLLPAHAIEGANVADAAYVKADGDAVWSTHAHTAAKDEAVDLVLRVGLTQGDNPPGVNSTLIRLSLNASPLSILEHTPAWKTWGGAGWAAAAGAAAFALAFLAWRTA